MDFNFEFNKNIKYKVVLIESDAPHSYSSKIDARYLDDNTVCLSVYNNPILYKLLTKNIEKYLS